MIIIVTDEGMYWNHRTPILEKYKKNVVVVCLQGKKVTDKYRCVVSPYEFCGLGMDISVSGTRYRYLKSIKDELRRTHSYHDDILFLADSVPQSLFPYWVLKDDEEFNRLHLWCMTPWRFEFKPRQMYCSELLNNVSNLTSLLCVDTEDLLKQSKRMALHQLYQSCMDNFSNMLPKVIYEIETNMKAGEKYYYDFSTGRYIQIADAYTNIQKAISLDEKKANEYDPVFRISCMGLLMPRLQKSETARATVQSLMPRIDGKRTCDQLKIMRKRLAEANGIAFETVVCPSKGPCAGTCHQCDEELRYLQREMEKISEEDRVYPKFKLMKDDKSVLSTVVVSELLEDG